MKDYNEALNNIEGWLEDVERMVYEKNDTIEYMRESLSDDDVYRRVKNMYYDLEGYVKDRMTAIGKELGL